MSPYRFVLWAIALLLTKAHLSNTNAAVPHQDETATGRPARTSPNVVVLLSDDLGWKDTGCYGGPVKTPALDGLAAKGVRFTDFYSGAAVCSPSRATVLTGRHHIRAGVYSWIQDKRSADR